jgi:hypothetical protein
MTLFGLKKSGNPEQISPHGRSTRTARAYIIGLGFEFPPDLARIDGCSHTVRIVLSWFAPNHCATVAGRVNSGAFGASRHANSSASPEFRLVTSPDWDSRVAGFMPHCLGPNAQPNSPTRAPIGFCL